MSVSVRGVKVRDVQRLLDQHADNASTANALQHIIKVKPEAIHYVLKNLAGARTVSRVNDPYRAAYIISAAKRISDREATGMSLRQATKAERSYYKSHIMANTVRRAAEKRDVKLSKEYGQLLGWYSLDDPKVSPECMKAAGNNFWSVKGTKIGRPGAVHPHCRCFAGPPHPRGKMVNDLNFEGVHV